MELSPLLHGERAENGVVQNGDAPAESGVALGQRLIHPDETLTYTFQCLVRRDAPGTGALWSLAS